MMSEAQGMPSVCPYLGLRAFREEDQAFYFGRHTFVELLAWKVAHQPIVAVLGPSGSGKSSVVLAGLLPLLRRQRSQPAWDAISFTPGDNPWWRLAHALMPLLQPDLSEAERIEEAGILARALLDRNGALAGTFARVLERSRGTDRLLVVVDQFEEMFTLAPGNEDLKDEKARKEAEERKQKRDWFLEDLLASTKSAPVTIVLTLRADYYGHALNASRELCDALNTGQVAVGPMLPDELRCMRFLRARTSVSGHALRSCARARIAARSRLKQLGLPGKKSTCHLGIATSGPRFSNPVSVH